MGHNVRMVIRQLLKRDGDHCQECGIVLTEKNRSIDNMSTIPGGNGDISKLRLLCRNCNARLAIHK